MLKDSQVHLLSKRNDSAHWLSSNVGKGHRGKGEEHFQNTKLYTKRKRSQVSSFLTQPNVHLFIYHKCVS